MKKLLALGIVGMLLAPMLGLLSIGGPLLDAGFPVQ